MVITKKIRKFCTKSSNRDYRLSSPERCMRERMSVSEDVVDHGLRFSFIMIYEMYIDDCTVFGDTNIEFVSRLKLIFGRFRKHNLYLKASKCLFGYSELEFVGRVVS